MEYSAKSTTDLMTCLLPKTLDQTTALALYDILIRVWSNYKEYFLGDKPENQFFWRIRQYLGDNWLQLTLNSVSQNKKYYPAAEILTKENNQTSGIDAFLGDAHEILRTFIFQESSTIDKEKRVYIKLREYLLDQKLQQDCEKTDLIATFHEVFHPKTSEMPVQLKEFQPNFSPNLNGEPSVEHLLARNNQDILSNLSNVNRLANLYPLSSRTNITLRDLPIWGEENSKFVILEQAKEGWFSIQLAVRVIAAWRKIDPQGNPPDAVKKLEHFWAEYLNL